MARTKRRPARRCPHPAWKKIPGAVAAAGCLPPRICRSCGLVDDSRRPAL